MDARQREQGLEVRMALAERDLEQILGNGQPGELANVKASIEDLKKWANTMDGALKVGIFLAGFGGTVIGGVLVSIITAYLHKP